MRRNRRITWPGIAHRPGVRLRVAVERSVYSGGSCAMSTGPTDDVVRLVTAENPVQAHIWERALQEEGIRARVVGDYLDAGLGDLPGLKPEIRVHRSEIARAE